MKIPIVIKENQNAFLFKSVWTRTHKKNQMFSVVACGERGSGKSWAMLSLAYLLDRDSENNPRFTIDRIAFSPLQFASLLEQDLPEGSCILLDEAGLALYSRESLTKVVRELTKLLQVIRYKNFILLFCLPDFNMLDVNARKLMNAYVELIKIDFQRKQSIAKWHWLKTNAHTGKIYRFRPQIKKRIKHVLGMTIDKTFLVNTIAFDTPPQELIVAYEKRKKEFLDLHASNVKNKLLNLEKKGSNRLPLKESVNYVRKHLDEFRNQKGLLDTNKLLASGLFSEKTASRLKGLLNPELRAKEGI